VVQEELSEHFVLARLNPRVEREVARQFSILWTPTLVFLHFRGPKLRETVGYLPPRELLGELRLARGLFEMRSARHAEAEALFAQTVSELPDTAAAPEALFWQGTTHYFRGDKDQMWQVWTQLASTYPSSTWALRTTLDPGNPTSLEDPPFLIP